MINIEAYREYCLLKKGVTEGFPFDENILVFKVMNKIFALTDINTFEYVNLKCAPERAVLLREEFSGILPGYHMNKNNWNSVYINSDVSPKLVYELINHSYNMVVKSLPKKIQKELEEME